jgi:hypothetical protein
MACFLANSEEFHKTVEKHLHNGSIYFSHGPFPYKVNILGELPLYFTQIMLIETLIFLILCLV